MNEITKGATLEVAPDGSTVIRLCPAMTREWRLLAATKVEAEIDADCEPSGFGLLVAVLPFLLPEVLGQFAAQSEAELQSAISLVFHRAPSDPRRVYSAAHYEIPASS